MSDNPEFKEDEPIQSNLGLKTEPYDPSRMRENVRVALVGFSLLMLIALLAFGTFKTKDFAEFKELLTIVFSPVIGIVSTALAFYFADKKN